MLTRLSRSTSFSGNVVSNYAGRLWEAGISIAFVPVYIHYLGPEAYGVIGLVAVIQSFMLVLDFGMTPTLTREAARYEAGEHDVLYLKDLIRSVEVVVLAVGFAIVLLIALAAPFVAGEWVRNETLSSSMISDALTIGGGLIALRFLESVFRGTLNGLQRQALCNAIGASFATLRGGGAVIVLAFFDGSLRGFFVWQVAASVLAVVAMRAGVWLAMPPTPRPGRFSWASLSLIGRFASGMVLISILSLAATQADKIILSRLVSLHAFGFYIFAANVAIVLELVSAPIMTAVYPRVIGFVSAGDEPGLTAFFHYWARIVTGLTAPIAALLVGFGPLLILSWSGNTELAANAGPLLSIIALGTFLHGQCVLPYYVQLAHGWTSLAVWVNAGALLITATSIIFFVPHFGLLAAAWTWVAVAAIYFFSVIGLMFSRILRGERWTFLFRDVVSPAVAPFATLPVLVWLIGSPHSSAARLFCLALAFAVLCCMSAISVAAGDRNIRRQITRIVSARIPKNRTNE